MAIDFNIDPWFDDFDATKNFHRILFKPGFAVQARELTQSQTILQDQISKFGLGIYADGSKVTGANITVDTTVNTCKLEQTDNIDNFVDLYAVGATSGLIIEVISVDAINYYISGKMVNSQNGGYFSSGETINFYDTKLKALASQNSEITAEYTATAVTESTVTKTISGTYLDDKIAVNTSGISVGDTITITSSNLTYIVTSIDSLNQLTINGNLSKDYTNESVSIKNRTSLNAMEVCIDTGVWFTNGLFVRNDASSIIPDKLNVYPSVVVGFEVTETWIDYFDDASLLDPAIGASNYQAPGADRYKVTLELTTKPYVSDQVIENLTNNKFIELVRINKGVIEDKNETPIFTEISKQIAQSVYDQSGDFVVNPYSLNILNLNPTLNTFSATISSGKVYVGGYPIEHIAPTKIRLEKARDTISDTNQDIVTYYGNYTTVKDIGGSVINFQNGQQVELHSVDSTLINSSTKIGTARVRNFLYDSGSGTSAQYKTFLFDVNLANNSFANVASMITTEYSNDYSSILFSSNTVSSSQLVDSNYDSLVFPLPQVNIENVTNTNYVTTRRYETAGFANGITSITTSSSNEDFVGGSGTISSTQAKINYILVATSSSGDYTKGQFIPLDGENVTVTISNSSVGPSQATFSIGGNFYGTASIYATISVTSDSIRSKSLITKQAVKVSAKDINTPIDLGKSDIYSFRSVYEISQNYFYSGSWAVGSSYSQYSCVSYDDGVVYISNSDSNIGNQPNTSPDWSALSNKINTGSYSFDNGQRDAYYDHGTVTNISGSAKNDIVVVFDYFTHSGGQGFFTLNSYTDLIYSDIPNFTSKLYGTTYNLRNVLDFRPRRTDGIGETSFDTFQLTQPLENAFVDYSYYLSRIDKIALQKNGQFKVIRGVSSYINPTEPADLNNTLTLFTIKYNAYTYNTNDIFVRPTNLRRYTMKDVGLLDKRLSTVEYYTSLSVLESQVTGKDVVDSTGQNILFKNGYLVDSFKGQDVGDVKNPDYAIAIDITDQLARPTFSSESVYYYNNESQGAFITSPGTKQNNKLSVKNNIVTFSYSEYTLVNQNVATQITNVNPFNVSNWIGNVKLSPSSDVWYDTKSQPIINIVNEDQNAWIAAVGGTGNGTQWNDWQINWSGQNAITSTEQNQNQISRDTLAIQKSILTKGLDATLTGGNIVVSTTNQILSSAIIPYMRSREIEFEVQGMPPYTYLHTFINKCPADFCVGSLASSTGGVHKIDIVNGGTGYVDGNNQSMIFVSGANTTPCVATANVSGGSIVAVDISYEGYGYLNTPDIYAIGANTSAAVLRSNTANYVGSSGLRTDQNGYASGKITIPNTELFRIPTGSVLIEFSDIMMFPTLGSAYAKTVFQSRGTLDTVQTTVVSTRTPISTPKPVLATGSTPLPNTTLTFLPNGNPQPFLFAPIGSANVNQEYQSETITIYGLEPNYSVTVSASGGTVDAGTSSLSGIFATSKTVTTSATGSLVVATKLTTGFEYSKVYSVNVSVGNQKTIFGVTTKVVDLAPDQFTIDPQNDANTSTMYTSNTVTVSGLDPYASILVSATGGTVDVGTSSLSGTFVSNTTVSTSSSGTFVFAARGSSSTTYSDTRTVSVLVGGISAPYIISTAAPDVQPNAFVFTDTTNATTSTSYTSSQITLTGMSPNTAITATSTGGTIDLGTSSLSGTFATSKTATTSANGTLVLAAKGTSSTQYGNSTPVTVTVGGLSSVYNITTQVADIIPDVFTIDAVANTTPNTVYTSNTVTVTGLSAGISVLVSANNGTIDVGTSTLSGSFATSNTVTTSGSGTFVFATKGTSSSEYGSTSYVTVTINGISAIFNINNAVADINPNAFTFDNITNASLGTSYTSNTVTLTGMSSNTLVTITASGGTIDANTTSPLTGTFSSSKTVRTSANGTVLLVAKANSSTSYQTTSSVPVTVSGGTVGTFNITTQILDNSPVFFSFDPKTNADISTTYTSNTVMLTGMSPNVSVTLTATGGTIDANTTSPLTGTFSSSKTVMTSPSGTVNVAARGVSSSSYQTTGVVSVSVGGITGSYNITTLKATIQPNSFAFTDTNNADPNTQYFSDTVTVSGLSPSVSVTITASGGYIDAGTSSLSGSYATSKTVTTSASGTLVVRVRVTSSSNWGTTQSATVNVGGKTATYSVTTTAIDTTPTPFSFTPVTNANIGQDYTSSQITVSGLTPSISIVVSASGGTVDAGTSVLSGTFSSSKTVTTSASGTIVIQAKTTSSGSYSSTTSSKVTIGGVSGTFSVTTQALRNVPNAFTFGKQSNCPRDTTLTSNTVEITGLIPNSSVTVNASAGALVAARSIEPQFGGIPAIGTFVGSVTLNANASGNIYVALKGRTSTASRTTTNYYATVNGVSGNWTLTTEDVLDLTPDYFKFTPGYNYEPGSFVVSPEGVTGVTVTGLSPNVDVVVSVADLNNNPNLIGKGEGQIRAGTNATTETPKWTNSTTVRTSASGTIKVAVATIVPDAPTTIVIQVGGAAGYWHMGPKPVTQTPSFSPVWSNDAITPAAETLTMSQGLALIQDAMPKGYITQVPWSTTHFQQAYSATLNVQRQLPTLAGVASTLLAIKSNAKYDGTVASIGAAISDIQAMNTKLFQTQNSIDYIENAAASYAASQGADLSALSSSRSTSGNGICIKDPLTQNFFVTDNYKNGVFLSSVDLFFATKDETSPVSISIRPTVNGYPDSSIDILGSIVYKNPSEINVPSPNDIYKGVGAATTFTFDHPIYLSPGQYSIMVASTSNKYNVYTSKQGDVKLGTETIVSSVSYAGTMFKSQNSQTWIPASGETLCFHLRICDFASGSSSFDITSKSSDEVEFDLVKIVNQDLSFNGFDTLNYKMITKNQSTGSLSSAFDVTPGQNHNFTARQVQKSAGDITIRPTLTNISRFTSPVIDLERLNAVLIRNQISPYTSESTLLESSPGFFTGGSSAKYISKRVTLNNNFDSTGLTVYLDVNRQPGTKIEVYYKVLNGNDQNNFDYQPYVLMNNILSNLSGPSYTGPTDWTEDTYQALNITYDDAVTGSTYKDFKVFAIKICMYSDNTAYVPQIKKLRVIASA